MILSKCKISDLPLTCRFLDALPEASCLHIASRKCLLSTTSASPRGWLIMLHTTRSVSIWLLGGEEGVRCCSITFTSLLSAQSLLLTAALRRASRSTSRTGNTLTAGIEIHSQAILFHLTFQSSTCWCNYIMFLLGLDRLEILLGKFKHLPNLKV